MNKLIEEFSQKYKSFNKECVINKLNSCYKKEERFHLRVPHQIKYIARKHSLPDDTCLRICQDLINNRIDNEIKLSLVKAVKYSIKKANFVIKLEFIVEILQKNQDASIQSEIIWILGYHIKNLFNKDLKQQIDANLLAQIKNIIGKNEYQLNIDSIIFFNHQIRCQPRFSCKDDRNDFPLKPRLQINYSRKSAKMSVTKTQQTVQIKHKNSESLEIKRQLNLVDVLMNSQKKIETNSNRERLPTILDQNGKDTSIWLRDYDNVVVLYNRMKSGQVLKKHDKDIYLASIFLQRRHPFSFSLPFIRSLIENLFINRMIVDIFLTISKRQMLHDKVIHLLMKCIDLEILGKYLFEPFSTIELSKKIATYNTISEIKRFLMGPNYSKLYKNAPKLVADMARKIFANNESDVTEIFTNLTCEIKKIRITAISAIHNCVIQDERILNEKQLDYIQSLSRKDDDDDFKSCIISLLKYISNNKNIDPISLFQTCLTHLEQTNEDNNSVEYIYHQSKNEIRFKFLFNQHVISRIIGLLRRTVLTKKTKMIICLIVNKYLERSYTEGLNETDLQIFSNIITSFEYTEDLKVEVLKLTIFSIEKSQSLPDFLLENLIENLDKGNERFDNIIILVLGFISETQAIAHIDKLTKKLFNDLVIVRDGTEISFERKTDYTNDDQTISSIVARIIWKSLKKKIRINDQILRNLVEALTSHDQQTCILVSKSLFIASETHELSNNLLTELKEHIDSKIHDVSVYLTIAYSRSLAKLSSTKKLIHASHIQILPRIFVFDDLKLDEKSFAEIINKNILAVLMNESKHRKFDEEIFQIFDHLLSFENIYLKQTLKILREYTKNKHQIPKQTIFLLENFLDISEFSKQILEIFKNIIYNKQIVSEKVLNIFGNNLYLSENRFWRNHSFKLLVQAEHNQDISDQLFDLLEVERASLSIATVSEDIHDALSYLCRKTNEGQKLTINCFQTLTDAFDKSFASDDILKILLNISNSGQIISNKLIEKIVNRYNPNEKQDTFIKIFENIVQNNQEISNALILKLEQTLENTHYIDQVLSIFVLLGQKGERFSQKILFRIVSHFLTINDPIVIQQYLSFICSIAETKDCFELISHIELAFVYSLKTNNQEIIRKTIQGFQILSSVHKIELNEISIKILVDLLENNICNANIQEQIRITLNYQSNDEFLNQLTEFDQEKLFDHHFRRIRSIIDSYSNLIYKALKILCQCSNKHDIPEKLFNSIIVLFSVTNSNEIKCLCCEILVQTRQFNNEILLTIINHDDDEERRIIKSVLENVSIPQEIRDHIDFLLKNCDLTNIQDFLNTIQEKLKKNIQLSNHCIEQLFSIEIYPDIEQQLIDIYALFLLQQPDYSTQDKIIENLEKSILSEKISQNVLNAYKEIIKRTQGQTKNFQNVIQCFIKILNKNNQSTQNLEILICISLASQVENISSLELFEINLSHENEIVRYWSLRGLRAAYERDFKSIEFEQYCKNMMMKLEEKLRIEISFDLNLFETIITLKYINYEQICTKTQDQWIRELVIFDLTERFQITAGERLKFYQIWLEIEEEKIFSKEHSDILIKRLHDSFIHNELSYSSCFQILGILKNIDFENALNILSNSKDPLRAFHKIHLKNMIQKRLVNSTEISTFYVKSIASDMIDKFQFDISEKFLNALENIDNLIEFQNMLTFAKENHIKLSDIYVENRTMTVLKRSLEIKFLGNQIKEADRLLLATCIDNLLDNHWTFPQLREILDTCTLSTSSKKERCFIEILTMLLDYKLSPTEEIQNRILIILRKPIEDWIREINKIIIECTFTSIGQVKNTAELIREFQDNNSHNAHVTGLPHGNLSSWIEEIKSTTLNSNVLQQTLPICLWNFCQIREWAKIVKKKVQKEGSAWTYDEKFVVEACAVTKRANYLVTGFHLTDAQVLSYLIGLHTDSGQGRLLQVTTGEGKTIIISILAVIHALRGNSVDIITSSPVLAERDSIKQTKFYRMFGLECSHNNDRTIYLAGPKPCYKKQIVYGEAAQFQFDTLRTEYAQLNTLAGRKCQVAIVDEVDSMLIDDSSKIARLATTIPGMDQLQIIYHFLWYELLNFQNKVIAIDDKLYYLYGKVGFENDIMFLEYADEEGNIFKIPNLKSYLSSPSDFSHVGKLISDYSKIDNFIKKHLTDYIKNLIKENIKIPKNFRDFTQRQISKWIDNAIVAYNYQENVHYVIHDGSISPVAYDSTGIIQSSSNWSDGLHQFLQIKHNLKMTSETYTTNFLSNKGYFTRYGSNLYGLTGTLGSQKAKEILAFIYKVDLVLIPNLRQKQYISLPDILTINEKQWLNEICDSAIKESVKGRGILIICETIEHSTSIAEKLKQKLHSSAIKLYTMNNMNQEKNVEIIHSGEIIVATNLAGRGTDIETDEIEAYGGLHVIVTFMPPNKRVEEQAFGRTARQGKRGTGRKILNTVDLIRMYGENVDMQQISEVRDTIESKMLDKFVEQDSKLISIKDELFREFCLLLNEIREKIRNKNGLMTDTKNQIKKVFKYSVPSVFESNLLMSIEEQWAMFLQKIDDLEFPIDEIQIRQKYEAFRAQILADFKNKCVVKNPSYYINIGNDLIINSSSVNDKYDRAMQYFNRAIELDPDHCAAAHAGKGWLLSRGKKAFLRPDQHESSYKQAAIASFSRALLILADEMSQIISIQALLQNTLPNMNTALSKQLIQKATILGNYCENLRNIMTIIRKSQRLIEITEHIEKDGELKQIILYDGIEKEGVRHCDIRLMLESHLLNHETAIENIREIGIIKKDETQFLIVYIPNNVNQLTKVVVINQTLKDHLVGLKYDETILNRDIYSNIYNLVYNEVRSNKGFVSRDFSKFLEKLQSDRKYQITLNDLTVRKDLSTEDQATQTIDFITRKIDENSTLHECNEDNRNIRVSMNQINGKLFKEFINRNIEIEEVTKDEALSQLKDKSSFFHRHLLPEDLSPDSCLIDFEIIYKNKSSETKFDLQARQIIDIIQNQTEDNLQYNLTFKSVNEISKVLTEKVIPESNLSVEFLELNTESIEKKIAEIQSRSINLEITNERKKLIEVIDSLNGILIELDLDKNEDQTYNRKIVDNSTAKRLIQNMTTKSLTVKLRDISKNLVKKVTNKCPDATYKIEFISIDFENLLKGLKDELINIRFDELSKDPAKTLIEQIRIAKFDFSLTFTNLTNLQVSIIRELTAIKQGHTEINRTKTLTDLFMKELAPYLELSEFSARGIEYLLEVSEKKFIPWKSIGCIAAIAFAQIAVGGVLISTGFGANAGLGSMTEGIADLVIALQACSKRDFSWADYGKQKAVSIAISVASMGLSSIKDAGKGIKTVVIGLGEETLQQASTKVATNVKSLSQVAIQSLSNLKSLPAKEIVVKVGENVLRVSLNTMADISSNLVLEQFKPQISASIQNKVSNKFCEPNLQQLVRKMYAIDLLNENQQNQQKINKIITDIINPEKSFFHQQWNTIGNPLCKGILSDVDKIRSPASMGIKILGIINGIYEITVIIDKIHEELLNKLSQIDQETLSIESILYKYCQVEKKDMDQVLSIFQQQNIIDLNEELYKPDFAIRLAHVHFNGFPQYKNEVINFLTLLHTNMSNMEFDGFSEMMKSISDMITEQIFQIIESQLISPVTSYTMAECTKFISENIQDRYLVNEKQNSDSQNREIQSKGKTSLNTIEKQIRYNARDYTIAYSQCEIIYYAQKRDQNSSEKMNQDTKNHVENIRKGEPSSMLDIIALTSENNLNVKLVDDPNYERTEEDKANGTHIIVYNKEGNNSQAYFQLMSSDGTMVEISSENKNSGYAIIQQLLKDQNTDVSINQLRNQMVQIVENNPQSFSRALKAQRWIETRYPQEANTLLMRCSGTVKKKSKLLKLVSPLTVCVKNAVKIAVKRFIINTIMNCIFQRPDTDTRQYLLIILFIVVLVLSEWCWYSFCFD